jgi:heptosyltransferase-2
MGFFRFVQKIKSKNFTLAYSLHKSARTSLLLFLAGIKTTVGFKSSVLSFLYSVKKHRLVSNHDVERNLSLLDDVEDSEKELKLYVNKSEDVLSKFQLSNQSYVVIAPGSVWLTKRWSATHFKLLVSELSKTISVVVTGSPDEKKLCDYVCNGSAAKNLAGSLNLSQTIGVISAAKGVVCNDSLPLHIASSFKRPVVALFCATSPQFGFGPWRTKFSVLESDSLSCKPCMRHGSNKCPTGTEACRTEILPLHVMQALKELAVI